jgi:dCMP deaminase
MLIAKLVSTRSTCNSRPTGAVLVKDRQILATGYNGSMPGAPHCSDQVMPDGSPYCHRRALKIADVDKYNYCRASHAEANAIAQAARYGVAIKGSTLYVTLQPCFVCIKLLATAQIKRVYFELGYESKDAARDAFWEAAVEEAGFEVFEQLTITPAALEFILPSLTEVTSRRRLAATAAAEETRLVGVVESD